MNLILRISKHTDNLSQEKEAFIDMLSFPNSAIFSFHRGDPRPHFLAGCSIFVDTQLLTSCQIHKIQKRGSNPNPHFKIGALGPQMDSEDGVTPRAVMVHVGERILAALLPFSQQVEDFIDVGDRRKGDSPNLKLVVPLDD